jgi:hypothetical protein
MIVKEGGFQTKFVLIRKIATVFQNVRLKDCLPPISHGNSSPISLDTISKSKREMTLVVQCQPSVDSRPEPSATGATDDGGHDIVVNTPSREHKEIAFDFDIAARLSMGRSAHAVLAFGFLYILIWERFKAQAISSAKGHLYRRIDGSCSGGRPR